MEKFAVIVSGLVLIASAAHAQPSLCGEGPLCQPPTMQAGASSHKESRLYVGLVWQIADAYKKPDFIIGYRHAKTSVSNKVSGADLSLKLRHDNDRLSLNSTRLMALTGNTQWMGSVGAGYSFADQAPLLTAGLQRGHLRGSVDYAINKSDFKYYIEVNSLRAPEKPLSSGTACPVGTTQVTATAGQDASAVVEGRNITITPDAPQISGGATCVSFPS